MKAPAGSRPSPDRPWWEASREGESLHAAPPKSLSARWASSSSSGAPSTAASQKWEQEMPTAPTRTLGGSRKGLTLAGPVRRLEEEGQAEASPLSPRASEILEASPSSSTPVAGVERWVLKQGSWTKIIVPVAGAKIAGTAPPANRTGTSSAKASATRTEVPNTPTSPLPVPEEPPAVQSITRVSSTSSSSSLPAPWRSTTNRGKPHDRRRVVTVSAEPSQEAAVGSTQARPPTDSAPSDTPTYMPERLSSSSSSSSSPLRRGPGGTAAVAYARAMQLSPPRPTSSISPTRPVQAIALLSPRTPPGSPRHAVLFQTFQNTLEQAQSRSPRTMRSSPTASPQRRSHEVELPIPEPTPLRRARPSSTGRGTQKDDPVQKVIHSKINSTLDLSKPLKTKADPRGSLIIPDTTARTPDTAAASLTPESVVSSGGAVGPLDVAYYHDDPLLLLLLQPLEDEDDPPRNSTKPHEDSLFASAPDSHVVLFSPPSADAWTPTWDTEIPPVPTIISTPPRRSRQLAQQPPMTTHHPRGIEPESPLTPSSFPSFHHHHHHHNNNQTGTSLEVGQSNASMHAGIPLSESPAARPSSTLSASTQRTGSRGSDGRHMTDYSMSSPSLEYSPTAHLHRILAKGPLSPPSKDTGSHGPSSHRPAPSSTAFTDKKMSPNYLESSSNRVTIAAMAEQDNKGVDTCMDGQADHGNSSKIKKKKRKKLSFDFASSSLNPRSRPSAIPAKHAECIRAIFGPKVDLYTHVLCVDREADDRQIRIAYFRCGRQLLTHKSSSAAGTLSSDHPLDASDVSLTPQARMGDLSTAAKHTFQAISMAFEILSKPDWKAEYDLKGLPPPTTRELIRMAARTQPAPGRSDSIANTKPKRRDMNKDGHKSDRSMPPDAILPSQQALPEAGSPPLESSARVVSTAVRDLTSAEEEDVFSVSSAGSGPILRKSASRSEQSPTRGRIIRWNENVEEWLYQQDSEELRLKLETFSEDTSDDEDDDDDDVVDREEGEERNLVDKAGKAGKDINKSTGKGFVDGFSLTQHLKRFDNKFVSEFLDDLEQSLDGLEVRFDGFMRKFTQSAAEPEAEGHADDTDFALANGLAETSVRKLSGPERNMGTLPLDVNEEDIKTIKIEPIPSRSQKAAGLTSDNDRPSSEQKKRSKSPSSFSDPSGLTVKSSEFNRVENQNNPSSKPNALTSFEKVVDVDLRGKSRSLELRTDIPDRRAVSFDEGPTNMVIRTKPRRKRNGSISEPLASVTASELTMRLLEKPSFLQARTVEASATTSSWSADSVDDVGRRDGVDLEPPQRLIPRSRSNESSISDSGSAVSLDVPSVGMSEMSSLATAVKTDAMENNDESRLAEESATVDSHGDIFSDWAKYVVHLTEDLAKLGSQMGSNLDQIVFKSIAVDEEGIQRMLDAIGEETNSTGPLEKSYTF